MAPEIQRFVSGLKRAVTTFETYSLHHKENYAHLDLGKYHEHYN